MRGGIKGQPGICCTTVGKDDHTFAQKQIADLDRGIEYTAGVVAQVQYQSRETAPGSLGQVLEFTPQRNRGSRLKLADAGIAEPLLQYLCTDTLELDDGSLKCHFEGLSRALAHDRQHDLGTGAATHSIHRLVQRQTFYHKAI